MPAPTSSANSSDFKDTSNTNAACHAVLKTTELLEAILLCLPSVNVFGVRRVSTKWLDTITSSTLIQQKTFLAAVPEGDRWIMRATANLAADVCDTRYSNFELVIAPTGDYERLHYVDGVAKEYCSLHLIPADMCPLLKFEEKNMGVGERILQLSGDEYGVLQSPGITDSEGSWTKMFLTNPPCASVKHTTRIVLDTSPPTKITACLLVMNGDGFTLGEVVEDAMSVKAAAMSITNEVIEGEEQQEVRDAERKIESQTKSLNDLIADLEASSGKTVRVKSRKIVVELKQMVTPTTKENELVQRGGIKLEETV